MEERILNTRIMLRHAGWWQAIFVNSDIRERACQRHGFSVEILNSFWNVELRICLDGIGSIGHFRMG